MSHLKLVASNTFGKPTKVTAQDVCLTALGWSRPRNAISPVNPEVIIEVRYQSGNRIIDVAGSFEWFPLGLITHYRTVSFGAIEHIELDQLPYNQVK